MNPTQQLALLRQLRESQSRSAREQQILSGRDWLFVSALVQFLTALYPLYRWFGDLTLRSVTPEHYATDVRVVILMLVTMAILLLLWLWAKYAPFRAAITALALYFLLQAGIAIYDPNHLLDGVASKLIILFGLIMAVRTGYRRRHSG